MSHPTAALSAGVAAPWQQAGAQHAYPHDGYGQQPSAAQQQWQGQPRYDYSSYYNYYQQYPQGSYDAAAYNQYYAQQQGQAADGQYYAQQAGAQAPAAPPAQSTGKSGDAPPPPPDSEAPPPPPGEEQPPPPPSSSAAAASAAQSTQGASGAASAAAPAVGASTAAPAPAPPADPAAYQQWYQQYYGQQGYGYNYGQQGYGYNQYYAQQPQQQAAQSYYQPTTGAHSYAGYSSASQQQQQQQQQQATRLPQPPAGAPPQPKAQPPWANKDTQPAAGDVGSYNQQPPPASYNQQPPPTSYGRSPAARPSKFSIRPNQPLVKQPQQPVAALPAAPAAPAAARPAYTPIPGPPAVAQAPAAAAAAPPPSGNPMHHQPLLDYVSRCLRVCKGDRETSTMKSKLTAAIKQAKDEGRIYLIDWDTHPMPSLAPSPQRSPSPGYDSMAYSSRPSSREEAWGRGSKWSEPSPRSKKRKGRRSPSPEQPSAPSGKRTRIPGLQPPVSMAQRLKQAARAERFGGGAMGRRHQQAEEEEEEIDYSNYIIKGTKQELEKSYFRLTSAPAPHEVRPEPVLRRALERLVAMIARGEGSWLYYLDQFKGMRQDITVQHLRSELTVQVYEAHGRASLEYGDVAEFNQCQTQLTALYAEGVAGCRSEFTAYHMLYQTVHAKQGQIRDLLTTWKNTPPEVLASPEAAHALQVRQAVFGGDWRGFFRLYYAAPRLGRALMDVLVPKMRFGALSALVKAFKPALPLEFAVVQLGFKQPKAASRPPPPAEPLAGCQHRELAGRHAPAQGVAVALAACVAWAQQHGAVVDGAGGSALVLDCKASSGKLFVPEDTSKVAHGDSKLAIEDFLAKAIA